MKRSGANEQVFFFLLNQNVYNERGEILSIALDNFFTNLRIYAFFVI